MKRFKRTRDEEHQGSSRGHARERDGMPTACKRDEADAVPRASRLVSRTSKMEDSMRQGIASGKAEQAAGGRPQEQQATDQEGGHRNNRPERGQRNARGGASRSIA